MANPQQTSLMVQGGPNGGMTIPLSGTPITLGRRSDNDVVVDEESVSRRHALILGTPGGFVLRDLNSTNGTYVEGGRIGQGEHTLKHGDRIRLGGSGVTFTFRQEGTGTLVLSTEPPTGGDVRQAGPGATGPVVPAKSEPQPADRDSDFLRLLDSKMGSVVSRDEIAREVWPDQPAGSLADHVIDQSVERIRARIEDDPLRPVKLITAGEFGFLLIE